MKGEHAILAFCEVCPEWSHLRRRFTAIEQHGSYSIRLDSIEIGRVHVSGREIRVERLIQYVKLGEYL